MNQPVVEKKKSKGKVIGIIGILIALIIGGGVAVFAMFSNSTKANYFKAERTTFTQLTEQYSSYFKEELDFYQMSQSHPMTSDLNLTLEGQEDAFLRMGIPPEMAKNAQLHLTSNTDFKKKQLDASFSAKMFGIELKDTLFAIHEHDLYVQLPFFSEILKISDKKINELYNEENGTTDNEVIDFVKLIEQQSSIMPDKDMQYLQKTIGQAAYDSLSDDAFKDEKEKITVFDNAINTDKITMTLNGKQIQTTAVAIAEKIKNDEKVFKIFQSYINTPMDTDSGLPNSFEEWKTSIDELVTEMKAEEPDASVESIIWTNGGSIVQRQLTFEDNGGSAFVVTGQHTFGKSNEQFLYEGYDKEYPEDKFALAGKVTEEKDKRTHVYTISGAGEQLAKVQMDEQIAKGKRNFTRTADINVLGNTMQLKWIGETTYESDQMATTQRVGLNIPEVVTAEDIQLVVQSTSKKVKSIHVIPEGTIKDLDALSTDELALYFEEEMAQFQEIFSSIFGGLMPAFDEEWDEDEWDFEDEDFDWEFEEDEEDSEV